MSGWQEFTGLNRGYVLELYEKYRRDPSSVDPETRALFEQWTPSATGRGAGRAPSATDSARESRRRRQPRRVDSPLRTPGRAGSIRSAAAADWRSVAPGRRRTASPTTICGALPANLVAGPLERRHDGATTRSRLLRRIYCSTTGYDYAHVFVPDEREWLRQAVERGRFRAPADPIDPVKLLDRLSAGRGVRALSAPHVPRQDALLDRGARHARAGPRRGDRRGGRGRHRARF